MNVLDRIDNYMDSNDISEDDVFDRALELIMNLDPDNISEEQAESVMLIINSLDEEDGNDDEEDDDDMEDDEDEEDEDEVSEFAKKKVRIDPAARRKRKLEYKKNKAKRKVKAKKYRKSAKGKQMLKKAKRLGKTGRTATGKKQTTYR